MRIASSLCLLLLIFTATACAQEARIDLKVDATDAPKGLLHATMHLPVKSGKMTLLYPKWIPGEHGPSGPITDLVNLKLTAGDRTIPWQRDPAEMYAIQLEVPAAVDAIDVSLDFLLSTGNGDFSSSTSSTSQLVDLSWNQVILYPQGPRASELTYAPSLRLPHGWKFGTALQVKSDSETGIEFSPVSLERLVDSPLIAGTHFRAIELGSKSGDQVLDVVADSEDALQIKPEDKDHFAKLVREAEALFGAHHYRNYHFLLTLSDQVGHFGLEHHESSDDRLGEQYLTNPIARRLSADLLPHEMTHSWNGKYRRPADIATPDYQAPMKTELLWVYEGLTQYLGMVLGARSGLSSADDFCQQMAINAAWLDRSAGRQWRPLADTAVAAQFLYRSPRAGRARRRGTDFYDEGALIWLEADVLIRKKTQGQKSLDDFCQKFFGPPTTEPQVVPYTYDDLVAALNGVCPYDWRGFFQTRIYEINPHAPLGGIEAGGWKLSFADAPNDLDSAGQTFWSTTDLRYSVGMSIYNKESSVTDVMPNSPADKAGMAPGMTLIAVNGRRFTPELLKAAIKSSPGNKSPIELLIETGDFYKTIQLDYHDGDKYPRLERDSSKPDLIAKIVTPLTTH